MKEGDKVYVVCEQTGSNGFFAVEEAEFIVEDHGYCHCEDADGLYMEKCSNVFASRYDALVSIQNRLFEAYQKWTKEVSEARRNT